TVWLMATALAIQLAIGLPLGVLAALGARRRTDRLIAVFSAITASFPPFLLGLLAILTFSIQLHLLPSGDVFSIGRQVSPMDWLRHIILPATVLALINAGRLIRYVRASLLDVLSADYLITARAKGPSSRQVIVGH